MARSPASDGTTLGGHVSRGLPAAFRVVSRTARWLTGEGTSTPCPERDEASQRRSEGWTYRQIADSWVRQHSFNPRVAFRLAHGYTQAQVACRWNDLWPSDAPMTAKQISYWEIWPQRGGRAPSLDSLNRLALIYQCRAGDLLGGEDYSHLDPAAPARGPRVELLTAALAVVVRESAVLLVCRRDTSEGISWGFPTGVVKPGNDPSAVAVRETLAETGVHCAVARPLGSRLHPLTGALCEYFLCNYLGGAADNRDVVENLAVSWVDRRQLADFVPLTQIFPPVLEALEVKVPGPDAASRPPVVAAIVVDHDRVLLVRRRISEGSLSWQFPGGEAESGESAQQAAVRETHEEVGLEVAASKVIGDRIHPATGRHMIYVACRVVSGRAHVADRDELAWARLTDLSGYIPSGLFPPVQQHLEGLLPA